MSIKQQHRVWEYSTASGSELLVLLKIADFADDDGQAWPSVSSLARAARVSERTAQYALRTLVAAGELEIERGTGRKNTNTYRVIVKETPTVKGANSAPPSEERVQPSAEKGATQRTKGCNPAPKRVQPIAPDPSMIHQDPPRDPSRSARATRETPAANHNNESPQLTFGDPPADQELIRAMAAIGPLELTRYQLEDAAALVEDGAKAEWFEDAIARARAAGNQRWVYIRAIIAGWIREGGPPAKPKRAAAPKEQPRVTSPSELRARARLTAAQQQRTTA